MEADDGLERLAGNAAKGDEDSFVALCDAVKSQLFRTAIGILGDEALALDAVSDAVFHAFKGIKRLREPKYARTWFTRILINSANDIVKRQKREYAAENLSDASYVDDHSDLEFFALITNLAPELREIVSLKYYSEFTLGEIALILRIPEGTVKSRLHKALKQLRLEVDDE